jgi:hypothetical protein
MVSVLVLMPVSGHAGWLFGDDAPAGRAGLNLSQGYDRNTVVTITGRVAALPAADSDPVTIGLAVASDRFIVVLGPRWYLQNDDLGWKVGDTVTVRGSRAQGKDGHSYLITQWISLPDGGQLSVRSDTGRPLWSGGPRLNTGQQQNQQNQQGGSAGRRGR